MVQTETPARTHGFDPGNAAWPGTHEGLVTVLGRRMYCIPAFDRMPPFLMSLVSDSDVWMFVSSRGGLTAGRVEPAYCVFPYETDDKLHHAHTHTGPQTIFRIKADGGPQTVWRPFHGLTDEHTQRTLYKSVHGTQLVFEERRSDHGLVFRYRWAPTDRFGLVRTAWIENTSLDRPISFDVLDGFTNILPAGVPLPLLQQSSCLANAYTQAEVDTETKLGLMTLTSLITDAAEPGECLYANSVWMRGLEGARIALDEHQIDAFLRGEPLRGESLLRNRRPAYLASAGVTLEPGGVKSWHAVADARLSQARVVALRELLAAGRDESGVPLDACLDHAVDATTENLVANVASADGLQHSADEMVTAHHFANVMFNNMRGGVIANGYRLDLADFHAFARVRNRAAAERISAMLPAGETADRDVLCERVRASGDADALRLCMEYLPITFGRRHGDPSRPWNYFAIRVRNEHGERVLDYQGNWRDIFQNWEALCLSFPGYAEGMIAKFVNASTADGFNPYRISREGIDWEVPDADDPWANIGYWGDHQIIYLLKLMELSHRFSPGRLRAYVHERVFATANVPYRIKGFDALVTNPRDSIGFESELNREIASRVERLGTDGRLVLDADERVAHVTLAEKLLVPLLAKVSNLVVAGGVWMNTQRPEWNDANNALAGYGLSVVTAAYMHRYAVFVKRLLSEAGHGPFQLTTPVARWIESVRTTLESHRAAVGAGGVDDTLRMTVLRELGEAFERYRSTVYANARATPGSIVEVPLGDVGTLLEHVIAYTRLTVEHSERPDGLFHSYNIVSFDDERRSAAVHTLAPMLEGQVAVLSSGVLAPDRAVRVLDALFESDLFRPDIGTFTLYPWKDLPRFLERNVVPASLAEQNPLIAQLLDAGEQTIVARDTTGTTRFSSAFRHAGDLARALDALRDDTRFAPLVEAHRKGVLDVYESVFNHHAFTGRSGTMYGYEGLGSVYWHMVSKLLLAAQECFWRAHTEMGESATTQRLRELYYRVRAGLGFEKSATEYGAFPTDPYSHTPADRGAQQPGMTGQVKEEVLTRAGELGLVVEGGRAVFRPALLRAQEFFDAPTEFRYVDLSGDANTLELPGGTLAFTWCQTPIVYHLQGENEAARAGTPHITITQTDGCTRTIDGLALDEAASSALFRRTGEIARIDAALGELPAGG